MNKKKILVLAMTLSMVAILALGATLAYFTDTDSAKNVMTLGNVQIKQEEWQKDEVADAETNEEGYYPFQNNKPLFPMVNGLAEGDAVVENDRFNEKMENVVDKFVNVTNEGTLPAYVRTIIAFETNVEYAEGSTTVLRDADTIFETYIGYRGDMTKLNRVITVDGVQYVLFAKVYEEALQPNVTSDYSLKQFFLSPEAGNEAYTLFGNEYTILTLSQATQIDGYSKDPITAAEALDTAFGALTGAEAVTDEVLAGWLAAAN